MEAYLTLFEKAIKKQADVVGQEVALDQAKKAGLGVTKNGRIVSCVGEPQVVLLKLIKYFVSTGKIEALNEVTSLTNEILGDETTNQEQKTALKI